MTYQTSEDIISAYTSALENEDDSVFEQGKVIAEAIDDKTRDYVDFVGRELGKIPAASLKEARKKFREQVLEICAQTGGQSIRTVRNREKLHRVFGKPGKRADHIRHSLHTLCTTGTEVDKPATYKQGYQWLELAEAGREIEDADGKKSIRPHTYATLKTLIIANGSNPGAGEPVYILDNVEATYQRTVRGFYGWTYELVIAVEESIVKTMPEFNPALPIFVTIVQPVQVPATEVTHA